eukprot:scaffold318_cov396-Prasinococcus_capsulatus_cf.AAC.22
MMTPPLGPSAGGRPKIPAGPGPDLGGGHGIAARLGSGPRTDKAHPGGLEPRAGRGIQALPPRRIRCPRPSPSPASVRNRRSIRPSDDAPSGGARLRAALRPALSGAASLGSGVRCQGRTSAQALAAPHDQETASGGSSAGPLLRWPCRVDDTASQPWGSKLAGKGGSSNYKTWEAEEVIRPQCRCWGKFSPAHLWCTRLWAT